MKIRDDGVLESVATSDMDDDYRYGGVSDESGAEEKPPHPLDAPKKQRLLSRMREWFDQEWRRQAFNRFQMAMDEDYYDSMQWTEEDAAELMARGQAPVVYNEIKPTIDWMIGTERRTRIDYKVLPRRKGGGDDAEVKTKLLKYLSDTNKTPYARSAAFAKAAKAGLGWLEIGVRGDDTDEPLYHRSQDWRYVLYDSNGVELDLSDSRYLFRWKYVDEDIALACFPDRADLIKQAVVDGDTLSANENEDELWYMGARVTEPGQDYASVSAGKYRPYDGSAFAFTRRERVKLIECWYRDPVKRQKFRGGQFDGEVYDPRDPDHRTEYENGDSSLYDRIEMQMRCAIYCETGLLFDGESPYRHNRFPLVPVWAYRRSRDNAPYGPIRPMRDSQDGLNKRNSKAVWILSSNRVEMEEGAVDDIEALRDEVARPDSVIVRKKGRDLQVSRDIQLAEEHLKLMDRDQQYIRNGGGVTSENLGRETNANSGKAIVARQEQGGVVTTEIFDNLRLAVQLAGEIELSLVEQFYTEEKVVRLVGDRGNASFVEINAEDPETGEILNDITAMQADFVVSEQDYRDSLRIAMFESLFEIVGRLAQMSPDTALNLLDLVVEMADVPNRDELVARIRKLNGQRDPESEPTPEELQTEQEKAAEIQEQKDIAKARALAELDELRAKAGKLSAEAVNRKLEAMYAAIQSGQLVVMNPGITPVADDLMTSAGFVDDNGAPIAEQPMQADPQNIAGPEFPEPEQHQPGAAIPDSPFVGQREGIETPENDGVR